MHLTQKGMLRAEKHCAAGIVYIERKTFRFRKCKSACTSISNNVYNLMSGCEITSSGINGYADYVFLRFEASLVYIVLIYTL